MCEPKANSVLLLSLSGLHNSPSLIYSLIISHYFYLRRAINSELELIRQVDRAQNLWADEDENAARQTDVASNGEKDTFK
jgi:hypothetical protein